MQCGLGPVSFGNEINEKWADRPSQRNYDSRKLVSCQPSFMRLLIDKGFEFDYQVGSTVKVGGSLTKQRKVFACNRSVMQCEKHPILSMGKTHAQLTFLIH